MPRCGSTFLMRVLRRGRNVCFGGETHDFIHALKRIHSYRSDLLKRFPQASSSIETQVADGQYPAFQFQATQDEWNTSIIHLMEVWIGALPKTEFWGWKEVVLGRSHEDMNAFFWLADLLPEAKFIILKRNFEEIEASMRKSPRWVDQSLARQPCFQPD